MMEKRNVAFEHGGSKRPDPSQQDKEKWCYLHRLSPSLSRQRDAHMTGIDNEKGKRI